MARTVLAILLMFALVLAPGTASATHSPNDGCGAPPENLDAAQLAGTFGAISRGTLRILVIGSASTTYGGTSGPDAVWPMRLQARLADRLGPVQVRLESLGRRGTTAQEHARMLAEEAPRFRPHLVIWQLGTVEAARGLPPEEMSDAVQEAAARLRAARGELTDLVLMDPQFSRFFRANANVEAYRDQLRMAAAASGAQLFSRWNIMRHWAESDLLDLERAPRDQRVRVADQLHDCIARALVVFIMQGAQKN